MSNPELRKEVEEKLRELQQYGNMGELCIGGSYYWVVPKVWIKDDIKKIEDEVEKLSPILTVNERNKI